MYDVGGKPLNVIKGMYTYNLACVRVKGMRASVSGLTVVRDKVVSCPDAFHRAYGYSNKKIKMGAR